MAATQQILANKSLRTFTSTAHYSAQTVLARDWISDSLYNLEHGYFNTAASPVGQLPEPFPFPEFSGQQAYLQQLRMWYNKLQVSWLTPAEIFHPHYGRAVATSMLQSFPPNQPLGIIEVGGGSGRLARDILDHLHSECPDRYADASYTSMEISPRLASIQEQQVLHDGLHSAQYQVLQHDGITSSAWDTVDERPCVIILMEVLDNLSHDRVWRHSCDGDWQEAWVEATGLQNNTRQQVIREVMKPVSDPLIWTCLAAVEKQQQGQSAQSWLHATLDWALGQASPSGSGPEQSMWLPTSCLHLLHRICAARPNHLLIAADFDHLPDVAVPGVGAPLVASTVNGQTLDHSSYLVPQGTADIFFPTNFQLLHHLHQLANAHHGEVQGQIMKTKAFMQRYGDVTATCTKSGYNPLLEDFSNTSFYTGHAGSCMRL